MAVVRDRPYSNQFFLVDLGSGDVGSVSAGFSEVILPEASIDVTEYRTGNDKESAVRKLPGIAHYTSVVLRRGVIGDLSLYNWFNEVRNGTFAQRNVVIQLQNEDRTGVVLTWKLLRAWPVRYSFSNLDARASGVLIEELVLAYERLEIE